MTALLTISARSRRTWLAWSAQLLEMLILFVLHLAMIVYLENSVSEWWHLFPFFSFFVLELLMGRGVGLMKGMVGMGYFHEWILYFFSPLVSSLILVVILLGVAWLGLWLLDGYCARSELVWERKKETIKQPHPESTSP